MIRFRTAPGGVTARLSTADAAILGRIPDLLDTLGEIGDDPAAARLAPGAYPDDPEADQEFRRFSDGELRRGRVDDREAFLRTVVPGAVELTAEDAARWLRVINETRLLLGARLGITDDGWERSAVDGGSRETLLHYLSWVQERLLAALDPTIAGG